MTQQTGSVEARKKTAELLAGVWKRNRPLIEGRLAVLEQARQQVLAGTLTEPIRAEAAEVAHKFSGSLGMFGLVNGTEIARELEAALGSPEAVAAAGPPRIAGLVEELRRVISFER